MPLIEGFGMTKALRPTWESFEADAHTCACVAIYVCGWMMCDDLDILQGQCEDGLEPVLHELELLLLQGAALNRACEV